MEKGPLSRTALKAEKERRKKASATKKSKRKYGKLDADKALNVQPNKEAKDKTNGEVGGTKTDGMTGTGGGAVAKSGKGKGGTEVATPDMISDFKTKKSPVYKVRFTRMNLVVAGGAYLP